MQSRYQFNVSVALAIGFGSAVTYALSSGDAVGYPMGAVSLGRNPIESAAGQTTSSPVTVFVADEAADFVVTDVVLTMHVYEWTTCIADVHLTLGSGADAGKFGLQGDGDTYSANGGGTVQGQVSHTFSSGILVPAGDSLTIHAGNCGANKVFYTLSGYHAQS